MTLRQNKTLFHYIIMILPGFVVLFFFNILPISGIVMAFKNFRPEMGIWRSPWAGFENFEYMFQLREVRKILVNTLVISTGKIVMGLVAPLIFALLLNEVKNVKFRRFTQTITYMPHFLSWVILAGIILNIFSYSGPINAIREAFGEGKFLFFADARIFPSIIIISDTWKEFGYNAVIYFAAIAGIDDGLYEAAAIDGAGRFHRVFSVTLPCISTTIILLAVLSLGNVLNAGFDQIFNLYNPLVYSTGDIIDTWVYRMGIYNFQYSLATAVGLLKSLVSLVLIALSYLMALKFANYRIF
jgi:putative aldouronate transport system permease protein